MIKFVVTREKMAIVDMVMNTVEWVDLRDVDFEYIENMMEVLLWEHFKPIYTEGEPLPDDETQRLMNMRRCMQLRTS